MKTWQKLLLWVAVVLVMVAAEEHENKHVCDFDQPILSDRARRSLIVDKVKSCFVGKINEEKVKELEESFNLEGFQDLFKDFCPHVQEVTTCMASVRNIVANCKLKNITRSFMLLSELVEHLVTAGCENSGDRLAHIVHGGYILLRGEDSNIPLKQCIYKSFSLLNLFEETDIDLTSESYIIYHDFDKVKACLELVEDEAYKSVAQWLLDEIVAFMKCKHPEEDTTVLCSELDVSKVPIKSICQLEMLNKDRLWSSVDDSFGSNCYQWVFSHDETSSSRSTDLEFLKDMYKWICKELREMPKCLLQLSSHGELCLPQEENKQFQLEVQAGENYMSRLCVEDGVFLANLMLEVYKNSPEHGNAFRDCYKVVNDVSEAQVGYASLNKNMKLYVDTGVYKKCVVGKLSTTNELASNLETAFNDILKKMKCVNPEDGSVVFCETIHEH